MTSIAHVSQRKSLISTSTQQNPNTGLPNTKNLIGFSKEKTQLEPIEPKAVDASFVRKKATLQKIVLTDQPKLCALLV
ncbi:hypothetical protein, partial [Staphylococcus saprophyticus]|uniref:hypothetical protein n=1 Tax=Staphylococcus saprophyticus TaxID=29385 RepID=UPI002898D36A